jgi:hypothetical protein
MLGQLPLHYWPILPPLVARAWLIERRAALSLADHVSLELRYSD